MNLQHLQNGNEVEHYLQAKLTELIQLKLEPEEYVLDADLIKTYNFRTEDYTVIQLKLATGSASFNKQLLFMIKVNSTKDIQFKVNGENFLLTNGIEELKLQIMQELRNYCNTTKYLVNGKGIENEN